MAEEIIGVKIYGLFLYKNLRQNNGWSISFEDHTRSYQ